MVYFSLLLFPTLFSLFLLLFFCFPLFHIPLPMYIIKGSLNQISTTINNFATRICTGFLPSFTVQFNAVSPLNFRAIFLQGNIQSILYKICLNSTFLHQLMTLIQTLEKKSDLNFYKGIHRIILPYFNMKKSSVYFSFTI